MQKHVEVYSISASRTKRLHFKVCVLFLVLCIETYLYIDIDIYIDMWE